MSGMEWSQYFYEHATPENYKDLYNALKANGMNRQQAIETLAARENMGYKNVERLVGLGEKIIAHEGEQTYRAEYGYEED